MKKFRFASGLAIGLIVGALLMVSTSAFATVQEKIEAYFAEYTITVNGEAVDLEDSKIIVREGTTYLPVRKISNILGYDVTYFADVREIALNNTNPDPTTDNQTGSEETSNEAGNEQISTEGWISYTDLAADYGLSVISHPEGMSISNGDVTLEVPNFTISDGETISVSTNLGDVSITKQANQRSMFLKSELIELGLITK